MLILIIGKSNSGKSAYAESLLENMTDISRKYYIATMKVCDEESRERKARHISKREGKGFVTIEQPCDIAKAAECMEDGSAALLECMTNLVANEMFDGGLMSAEKIRAKVLPEVEVLAKKLKHLLIVSGDFTEFSDKYDEETKRYIEALTMMNELISERADKAVNVSCGIPEIIKDIQHEGD